MKLISKFILIACLGWHLSLGAAPPSALFWEVSNETQTFYILGVSHVGDERHYPLAADVFDALKKSSIYITESRMTFDSADEVKKRIRSEYMAKSGQTLRELLAAPDCMRVEGSETIASRIRDVLPDGFGAKLLNISPRASIHQLAHPSVDARAMAKSAAKPAPAVEAVLRLRAKEQGIPYGALDDEYWRGIDQLSTLQTCKLLISLLQFYMHNDRDKIAMASNMKGLAAWSENDSDAILSGYFGQYEASDPRGDSSALREWMKNRNLNMVRAMESFSNRHSFVAVGAAHLAGADGIIAILKRRGFVALPRSAR
jgi:uncharacterized protein YbaP (TraB family)